ncbi:MAG TPA: DUF4326 domain-containing protein [Nitrospira sp.]
MKPVRLQLSRRRGFDLQAASAAANGLSAISCARPGPRGNPFVVGVDGTREECVRLHATILGGYLVVSKANVEDQKAHVAYIKQNRSQLRGHNLACFCRLCPAHKDKGLPMGERCAACGPCHVTNILEAVNR